LSSVTRAATVEMAGSHGDAAVAEPHALETDEGGTCAAVGGLTVENDEEYSARLRAVLAAYDDDRLLLASRLLAALRNDLCPAATPHGTRRQQALDADPRVRAVDDEMADVRRIYEALHDGDDGDGVNEGDGDVSSGGVGSDMGGGPAGGVGGAGARGGWINCYAGASTRVDYRPDPDKVSHTMRAQGEIRAPLRDVAALLNEPDLFPSVFWFVTRVEVLGVQGRFKRAADLTFISPPPLSNRHVRLCGFAVDGLDEDDCVLVVSRDLRDSDGFVPLADENPAHRRAVRARVHYSMFELKPKSPGITKVRLIANSDPNVRSPR
jgi:hypothetical protein